MPATDRQRKRQISALIDLLTADKNTACNPQFSIHAAEVLGRVKRDFVSRNTIVEGSGGTVTFVGVHDRRTDYLEFRRKRLKLQDLYHGYFEVRCARHLQIQKLTCWAI